MPNTCLEIITHCLKMCRKLCHPCFGSVCLPVCMSAHIFIGLSLCLFYCSILLNYCSDMSPNFLYRLISTKFNYNIHIQYAYFLRRPLPDEGNVNLTLILTLNICPRMIPVRSLSFANTVCLSVRPTLPPSLPPSLLWQVWRRMRGNTRKCRRSVQHPDPGKRGAFYMYFSRTLQDKLF